MPLIPRTPLSPKRIGATNQNTFTVPDVYDRFVDYYFRSDPDVRPMILERIINFLGQESYTHSPVAINAYTHSPVAINAYTHLLRTMDKFNAHHVMGYIRSQRNVEMYLILDQILRASEARTVHTSEGF